MDCQDVRPRLLDDQRNRLAPEVRAEVRAHLDGCPACARAEAGERALTELLDRGMPQHPASLALKRRLAAEWPAVTTGPGPSGARLTGWRRWRHPLLPALAVAAVLLIALPVYRGSLMGPSDGRVSSLVTEAVNDHLRVLASQHPLDIQSGGIHQVKPWFEGRLDFAPVVAFEGDGEVSLEGGAVGYFLDRKAAVFVYRYRLHAISLIVFRADGLAWPERGLVVLGGIRASRTTSRGFNVVLWRAGGLGYALVSDADAAELARLAPRIAGGA
jgi:anti-sigma factor RsiW